MIFSQDAPSLENELHKAFAHKKVNMLNYRKEFFNITIDEIEQKVKEIGLETEFIRLPEAMEYRETLAILTKQKTNEKPHSIEQIIADEFPATLSQ
ncbi:MAG: chromosome partitioning protein ParA [Bacteroidetes bacterium]|nr:chromosome partitioning protein ParA [Bacteroidota bacterium]